MKLKSILPIISILSLTFFVTACHAQIPPTSGGSVNLSWTAGTSTTDPCGTGASACGYVISRIILSAGETSCPAANVVTPNYTPLNQAAPVTGTSYTDSSAVGETVCYIAQTVQGANLAEPTGVSLPSNTAGPYTVPGVPGAPTLSGVGE